MPKLLQATPKYRHHKPSDQAVVTLNGIDHYLGPWRSKASKIEYDRLIGEWLANGRRAPATQSDLTVTELANRYRKFAQSYYVKNGQQTGTMHGVRVALRFLRQHYGPIRVAEFGPLALKALQMRMIEAGHCRRPSNQGFAGPRSNPVARTEPRPESRFREHLANFRASTGKSLDTNGQGCSASFLKSPKSHWKRY